MCSKMALEVDRIRFVEREQQQTRGKNCKKKKLKTETS